jgi:hypothetical protein
VLEKVIRGNDLRLVAPVWSRSTASGKVGTGSVILTSYEGRQQRVPDPIVSARASNELDRFLRSTLLNRVRMDSVGSGPRLFTITMSKVWGRAEEWQR